MAEVPEVETLVRDLREAVVGKQRDRGADAVRREDAQALADELNHYWDKTGLCLRTLLPPLDSESAPTMGAPALPRTPEIGALMNRLARPVDSTMPGDRSQPAALTRPVPEPVGGPAPAVRPRRPRSTEAGGTCTGQARGAESSIRRASWTSSQVGRFHAGFRRSAAGW